MRLGLRPLDAIGDTAAAIAAGDLSRRVERAEERTEVGRLGLSLNAMLSQIESAFRQREASERKLRRFVADASHELRTPLAAVRAYAELFDRGAAERPEDLERSMTGIGRESERMSLLVDDLLLLARLDDGRPLERARSSWTRSSARRSRRPRRSSPSGRSSCTPTRPSSWATATGSARSSTTCSRTSAPTRRRRTPVSVSVRRRNGTAAIAVTDSGPGLDEEHLAHVFERFYRADSSRARASGGVGLGLSIVAAVAEAHGGTVSARSTPDGGATFEIALPSRRRGRIHLTGVGSTGPAREGLSPVTLPAA